MCSLLVSLLYVAIWTHEVPVLMVHTECQGLAPPGLLLARPLLLHDHQDVLQQFDHAFRRDSAFIANFSKDETQFLRSHFLARTNVLQNLLHTRHDDLIVGIFGSSDNFLLEAKRCLLSVATQRG